MSSFSINKKKKSTFATLEYIKQQYNSRPRLYVTEPKEQKNTIEHIYVKGTCLTLQQTQSSWIITEPLGTTSKSINIPFCIPPTVLLGLKLKTSHYNKLKTDDNTTVKISVISNSKEHILNPKLNTNMINTDNDILIDADIIKDKRVLNSHSYINLEVTQGKIYSGCILVTLYYYL